MAETTPKLILSLFGGLRLSLEGGAVLAMPPLQSSALLALVALAPECQCQRDDLIAQFWPEDEPERARSKLRYTLHSLREMLEQPPLQMPEILVTSRTSVQLSRDLVRTDVAEFDASLQAARRTQNASERARHLQAAVEIYSGELLPGFYQNAIVAAQMRYALLYEEALHDLTEAFEAVGDLEQAIATAQRAVAHNPLLEEMYVTLMRLYAELGQPAAVLKQYQMLERVLRDELGEEPSPTTRLLMETLRRQAQERVATNGNGKPLPAATPTPEVAPETPPSVNTVPPVPVPAEPRPRRGLRRFYLAALVGIVVVLALYRWQTARPLTSPLISNRASLLPPAKTAVPPAASALPNSPLPDPGKTTVTAPKTNRTTTIPPAPVGVRDVLPLKTASLPARKIEAPTTIPEAKLLWVMHYPPASDETDGGEATGMVVDTVGNIYITGFVHTQNYDADFLTLKYSPNGELLWRRRYDGPNNDVDRARSIALDTHGDVYVTGESDNGGGNGEITKVRLAGTDYATVKYDGKTGLPSSTWPDVGFGVGVRRYNGLDDGEELPRKVCVSSDGSVYVTGYSLATRSTENGVHACREWATVKYNPDGIQAWVRRVITMSPQYPLLETESIDMIIAPKGDLLITGNVQVDLHDAVHCDIETRRYSPDGTMIWSQRYGRPGNTEEQVAKIALDETGAIYIAGITYRKKNDKPDFSTRDILILKYDAAGHELWVNFYDYVNLDDISGALAVDRTGNIYIGGLSDTWQHDADALMLKYNAAGDFQWNQFQNGTGNAMDGVHSVTVDSKGNPVFTGRTYNQRRRNSGRGWDYFTTKFDANGRPLWRAIHDGGELVNQIIPVAVDKYDNVIITGTSYNYNKYHSITILKYAP